MKDAYDKLKIWSEVLKNNWPQILLIGTLLSSGMGNIGQYFAIQDKEQEKNKAVREVATAFQTVMIEEKPIEKTNCGNCESTLKNHIKQYKRDLYEFHGVRK